MQVIHKILNYKGINIFYNLKFLEELQGLDYVGVTSDF